MQPKPISENAPANVHALTNASLTSVTLSGGQNRSWAKMTIAHPSTLAGCQNLFLSIFQVPAPAGTTWQSMMAVNEYTMLSGRNRATGLG